MPAPRTEITEIITGLGMLSLESIEEGLRARPAALVNVTESHWSELQEAWRQGLYREEFVGAFANGRAFLRARDGLRWRTPLKVEWKGPHRLPAYDFLPADLRVDHVFLVSCKYLSRILVNASPFHLFERGMESRAERTAADWYEYVAPGAYHALYQVVRRELRDVVALPEDAVALSAEERNLIKTNFRGAWPEAVRPAYRHFSYAVAERSCGHWTAALPRLADREVLLWRLLRLNSSPYFVLGLSGEGSLRLRIGTPWDWRQQYELREFDFWPEDAGQPRVAWRAVVRERQTGRERSVDGHVEIRWSHGKFAGSPEAKVYLDSPYDDVPGYHPLA
jgi:hypothetical protein